MSAIAHKRLAIRSDEAYELAHLLAREFDKTVTEVVLLALRQYEASLATGDR